VAKEPLPFTLADDPDDAPEPSDNPRQDVDETIRLLRWARRHGWAIPALRIGSVELQVRDLKPTFGKVGHGPNADSSGSGTSIWDEYAPPGAEDKAK
jgi:hypothetical protein